MTLTSVHSTFPRESVQLHFLFVSLHKPLHHLLLSCGFVSDNNSFYFLKSRGKYGNTVHPVCGSALNAALLRWATAGLVLGLSRSWPWSLCGSGARSQSHRETSAWTWTRALCPCLCRSSDSQYLTHYSDPTHYCIFTITLSEIQILINSKICRSHVQLSL